jgi:ABC-2 type transport system ATP-binding protein
VRSFVRSWIREQTNRTLLLTTHYMAEAEDLCDRVAIINDGRVLACDTPANLKRRLQQEAIFQLDVSPLRNGALAAFDQLPGVRKAVHTPQDGKSELQLILAGDDVLGSVIGTLSTHGAHLLNLQKREPTLEDVFVDLVGLSMAEAEKAVN